VGLYDERPICQGCGGSLIGELETCLCGGVSQYRDATSRRREVDEWSSEAEALLAREPEAPQPRSWREARTWQQKFSAVRRRYRAPGA
jgi:hypothetical protein